MLSTTISMCYFLWWVWVLSLYIVCAILSLPFISYRVGAMYGPFDKCICGSRIWSEVVKSWAVIWWLYMHVYICFKRTHKRRIQPFVLIAWVCNVSLCGFLNIRVFCRSILVFVKTTNWFIINRYLKLRSFT